MGIFITGNRIYNKLLYAKGFVYFMCPQLRAFTNFNDEYKIYNNIKYNSFSNIKLAYLRDTLLRLCPLLLGRAIRTGTFSDD